MLGVFLRLEIGAGNLAIAGAASGVLQTDLPQSELPQFAELAMKARSHKITSVNFVPPLIKPWDYDPHLVTRTVASTIRTSEKAGGRATNAAKSSTTLATPRSTSAAKPSPAPSARAAATPVDPKDAGGPPEETDLAAVCAAPRG